MGLFKVEVLLDSDDVVAKELEDMVDVEAVIVLIDVMVGLLLVVGIVIDIIVIV